MLQNKICLLSITICVIQYPNMREKTTWHFQPVKFIIRNCEPYDGITHCGEKGSINYNEVQLIDRAENTTREVLRYLGTQVLRMMGKLM